MFERRVVNIGATKRAFIFLMPFIAGIATDRLLMERPAHAQATEAPSADAGHPSLTIGDIPLTVGETRETSLAELSRYNVGKTGNRVVVTTKPVLRDGVNYFRILGRIDFENERIKEVTRNWGEDEDSPEVQRLWRSIWGAITKNIPESPLYTPVSLRAYATVSPQGRSESLDILVAAHRVVSIEWVEVDVSGQVVSPSVRTLTSVGVEETVF